MRRVNRLPDRVKIKWELLHSQGRRLDARWVDSTLQSLKWVGGDPDWREVNKTIPPPDVRGIWHLVCVVKDAATFDTTSKELEPNDVSVDEKEVIWKEVDGHYQREKVGDVTVVQSGDEILRIDRKVLR